MGKIHDFDVHLPVLALFFYFLYFTFFAVRADPKKVATIWPSFFRNEKNWRPREKSFQSWKFHQNSSIFRKSAFLKMTLVRLGTFFIFALFYPSTSKNHDFSDFMKKSSRFHRNLIKKSCFFDKISAPDKKITESKNEGQRVATFSSTFHSWKKWNPFFHFSDGRTHFYRNRVPISGFRRSDFLEIRKSPESRFLDSYRILRNR